MAPQGFDRNSTEFVALVCHTGVDKQLQVLAVNINEAKDLPQDWLTIESSTADKGYFALAEMKELQKEEIRTVISDPVK